jgi:hypothetical protein
VVVELLVLFEAAVAALAKARSAKYWNCIFAL